MFLFGAPGSLCGFFPMVSVLLTKSVVFVLEFANLSGTIIRSERRSHHGSIGRANQISSSKHPTRHGKRNLLRLKEE